jgi:hypothetical protein
MAHYAFLDEDNVVTEVIVGIDETELIEGKSPEEWYGEFRGQRCVRTSYNAATNGFRKNYAGIGFTYHVVLDAFIPPKPFDSWVLNTDTCNWEAPIPYPDGDLMYAWNEEVGDWEAIEFPIEL